MKIDDKNWMILEELQQNSRVQITDMAKKVGLSSPSVADRVNKMEQAGIIDRYETTLNMQAIGYNLGVYISIKVRFGQLEHFKSYVKTVPEICECHSLTGNDCMLMKAYVRDTKHLEDLNGRLNNYGELTTSLILNSIVKRRIYKTGY